MNPTQAETDRSLFVSRIKTLRVAVPEVSPGTHTLPLYSATLNILTFSLAMIISRSPDKSCTSGHRVCVSNKEKGSCKGSESPLGRCVLLGGVLLLDSCSPRRRGVLGTQAFYSFSIGNRECKGEGWWGRPGAARLCHFYVLLLFDFA